MAGTAEIETLLEQGRSEWAGEAQRAAQALARRAALEGAAEIVYWPLDSAIGTLLVAVSARGLVRLAFAEEGEDAVLAQLAARLSPRIVCAAAPTDAARRELEQYLDGSRRDFDLALDWELIGPFARRVLSATAAIPYGDVKTYSEIAAQAGSPRGSRAAGNALGSNPIPLVIPCHRVLRRGGALGGYGGGIERKRWLLALESGDRPGPLTSFGPRRAAR